MNYIHYKSRFPEDVLVYIEEFNADEGTVVFDFINSNEYTLFTNLINTDSILENPSMVLLLNYKGRRIQENTIYSIKAETISYWNQEDLITATNTTSFLLGYTIDTQSIINIFYNSISFDEFSEHLLHNYMHGMKDISNINLIGKGKLSVTVRNVGQGSWNEISFNEEPKIIYDAGAPMSFTRSEVINLIGNKNALYSLSKPILTLSHWDKDHYHSLLGMTDNDIKNNFSSFICRDRVPNLTSRLLFRRIELALNSKNIYSIPAANRNTRGGPTYFKPLNQPSSPITIYNSQHHKNRNISGIAISVKAKNCSIILPGDAHYEQISRDILPHLNYPHQHNLVVPHHGGKAGNYSFNKPPSIIANKAIVSVGKNKYGHPRSSYITSLRSSGFHVQQTNIVGRDITIPL